MLLTSFFDVLGIAAVIPFLSLLGDTAQLYRFPLLIDVFALLNLVDVKSQIAFVGFLVIGALTISLALRALLSYLEVKITLEKEATIGRRLLNSFFLKPYAWYFDKNTSALGKDVLTEVGIVVNQALLPAMRILSSSCTVVFITIFVFLMNWKAALISFGLISFFFFTVYIILRSRMVLISTARVKANEGRFLVMSEAFSNIKFVKLSGSYRRFLNDYTKFAMSYARALSKSSVIGGLPRYFLEWFIFGGAVGFCLILLMTGGDLDKYGELILLFAISGYRLLPSLQQIYLNGSKLKLVARSIDLLHGSLCTESSENSKVSHDNAVFQEKSQPQFSRYTLTFKEVSYTYPGSSKPALENISFVIGEGEKICIIGESGSGKSTLLDLILGLIEPTTGSILLNGVDLRLVREAWQQSIGYVPQQIYLLDDTIKSNICFVDPDCETERLNRALWMANAEAFAADYLGIDAMNIGDNGLRLSGGQRQRIGIARAMYRQPRTLVFDEGTSALDQKTEEKVLSRIGGSSEGLTVILVTHRPESVTTFDQVLEMRGGWLTNHV